MAARKDRRRRQKMEGKAGRRWLIPVIVGCVVVIAAAGGVIGWRLLRIRVTPTEALTKYFSLLNDADYEEMYSMLSSGTKEKVDKDSFIERNQRIYEGVSADNIKVKPKGEPVYKNGKEQAQVSYSMSMDTSADEISFDNKMNLVKEDNCYRIEWDSTLIFPSLKNDYKVQIKTLTAKRGTIRDRNGEMLAGQGNVSEVGIVPGKLGENKTESIKKIGNILDMTEDEIHNRLGASYVQDDSFVPLKEVSKSNTAAEEELLKIPGIMINDKEERIYPLGAAAGHLTGYVQAITAEELEELRDKGYHENSVIGKSGLERAFEDELRSVDGSSIEIVDAQGTALETLALKPAADGKDVRVTIDAKVQSTAYEQFASDPGTAAAMNPKTGEVLALVSTPGFDPNEFVMGMSDRRWNELNDDKNNPLMNRFNTSWVPGSTFKAITAAIGVDTGKIQPDANMGYVGLSWQKDGSWGDYHVTTLTDYGTEVNLENALVYSDNIYFARAALDIGADTLIEKFQAMGFEEEIPFELTLSTSTYDDDGKIDSDIQLADTGYGQGQLLVNPVHMLSMYTMFVNSGSMLKPTILYEGQPTAAIWKENVVSPETAELVKNDLLQVVENPTGTGASAKIDGLMMLGKTGTAEIKESQDDTDGIERGWFVCETTETIGRPVLVAGMVEDVKDKGGSGYVTAKVREIVAAYEQ